MLVPVLAVLVEEAPKDSKLDNGTAYHSIIRFDGESHCVVESVDQILGPFVQPTPMMTMPKGFDPKVLR